MNVIGYLLIMALYLKLPDAVDQHTFNHRRRDELLESGEMERYETRRVETDRHGHLVLSPWAIARHGIFQSEVIYLFAKLLPGGRTITECPVSTADGVKLVDAARMSRSRFDPMRELRFSRKHRKSVWMCSPPQTPEPRWRKRGCSISR